MSLSDYTALADFCEVAGEPMRACYRIPALAQLLDVPVGTIYDELDAGRLKAYMPRDCERGRRIRAAEVNRWLEETW